MKRLLFFLIIFITPIPAGAQTPLNPVITLEKTLFDETQPVNLTYSGEPMKLHAEVTSGQGASIPFKAVLVDRTLTIVPDRKWQPDTYHLVFMNDQTTILDQWITVGTPQLTIHRSQSSFIETGRTQTIQLSVSGTLPESTASSLIEFVPFDAIITNANLSQLKLPELVHPRYPFDGQYEITLPFGKVNPDEHLGMPNHDGVDFAVPMGTPIKAVDDGEIVPYREVNDYGTTIAIQHSWGQSFYGHLSSTSAQIGDKVMKGQIVGRSGNTGRSTGAHLHFGMKWNNESMIDPAPFLHEENTTKIAEKKLIIPITQTDQTLSYTILLPTTSAPPRVLQLSPAYVENGRGLRVASEQASRTLLTGPTTIASILQNDTQISSSTIVAQQDSVVLWKNEGEQRIHAYDEVSGTYSIQPLSSSSIQDFAIGERRYSLSVIDRQLILQ